MNSNKNFENALNELVIEIMEEFFNDQQKKNVKYIAEDRQFYKALKQLQQIAVTLNNQELDNLVDDFETSFNMQKSIVARAAYLEGLRDENSVKRKIAKYFGFTIK